MTVSSGLGAEVKRVEDPRLIRGQGSYVDDIKLPKTVYAAIVRSPHAHAKIKRIDVKKALKQKGVIMVLTGEEVASATKPLPILSLQDPLKKPRKYALAVDRVIYCGDPVAVVVADSHYGAQDAAELIEVEYEPLKAVTDPEKAMTKSSGIVHPELGDNIALSTETKAGDANQAFETADVKIETRFVNQRLAPVPMEPRAVLANCDSASNFLTVWTSTQIPHIVRTLISKSTGFPESKIRVIAPDVGGGFGCKVNLYSEEILIPYIAIKLRRPVKWIERRGENFLATIHGRDQIQYLELAATSDGIITGLRGKIVADLGSYHQTLTPAIPTLTPLLITGAYKIPNVYVQTFGVFTNKMPTDAYRGAGRPEAAAAVEQAIDILASKLNLDPVELRRRNFIQPSEFPYKISSGLTLDSGDYPKVLEKALKAVNYDQLRADQKKRRETGEGKLLGIGVATAIEICGFGPSKGSGLDIGTYETATVRVDPTGKVTAITGTSPHGQGSETSMAQIVSEILTIPLEDVTVLHGDTLQSPYGIGTFGSRSAAVGGTAMYLAANKVKEKAMRIAAGLLEARPDDLYLERSSLKVKGAAASVLFSDVAKYAYLGDKLPQGMEAGLEATIFHDPPGFTFPNSVHIAVVEVDGQTGRVELTKYVAVDDVGNMINPMIVRGQIHGGAAQGIAQALYEEMVYDEEGQPVTGSLTDYLVPTALEIPALETYSNVTPGDNPLGVKGVGEIGTIAATPAVANAVRDALNTRDPSLNVMPIKPQVVWNLIKKNRQIQ